MRYHHKSAAGAISAGVRTTDRGELESAGVRDARRVRDALAALESASETTRDAAGQRVSRALANLTKAEAALRAHDARVAREQRLRAPDPKGELDR